MDLPEDLLKLGDSDVFANPFDSPSELCATLERIGFLTSLRIEGIVRAVVPEVRYTTIPYRDVQVFAKASTNKAGVMKEWMNVGTNDRTSSDIAHVLLSYFLMGYVKIRVDFTGMDVGLAGLFCKAFLSFSENNREDSMIDNENRLRIDNQIFTYLSLTSELTYVPLQYDPMFPLNGLMPKFGERRQAYTDICSDNAGRGWLNNGGRLRDEANNIVTDFYGCETVPVLGNPLARNYESLNAGDFTRFTRDNAVMNAIPIVAKMIDNTLEGPLNYVMRATMEFYTRMNDYMFRNYGSGFRMTLAQLRTLALTENSREVPIYEIHGRSILYWAKCTKDEKFVRKNAFIDSFQMEAAVLKDINDLMIHLGMASNVRNLLDPQGVLWSIQEINNAVMKKKESNSILKYIGVLKRARLAVDLTVGLYNRWGFMSRATEVIRSSLSAILGAMYVTRSIVIRNAPTIISLADYTRIARDSPVIHQNLVDGRAGVVINGTRLSNLLRTSRLFYEIALASGAGVRILLPAVFEKRVDQSLGLGSATLLRTDVRDVDAPLRNLIELKEVKWAILTFVPHVDLRPDILFGVVLSHTAVDISDSPRVFPMSQIVGIEFDVPLRVVIGKERFQNLLSS
ncbi:unnamed protein product [Rotaria magnacalcarata]|nr:unnamed protein product [Rotaria magnacalcarata]